MGIILDGMFDVWRADRGDNDLLGWATTLAYLLAALFCTRTALAARHSATATPPRVDPPPPPTLPLTPPLDPKPYFTLAAGLLLLGLNKQLDLQILVRELGVRFIYFLGMEPHRRWFGRLFVLVMALILLRVMATAVRQMAGHTRGHRLLLTGLALLATFAVVRAGTYVPGLKQVNLRFGKALHLAFEFGGVFLVALSAWQTRQRLVRHHNSNISSA